MYEYEKNFPAGKTFPEGQPMLNDKVRECATIDRDDPYDDTA